MMTVAIACTWKPYGDEQRLQAVAARFAALGIQLCVALIDGDDAHLQLLHSLPTTPTVVRPPRGQGRYAVVQAALTTSATHMLAVDTDRLLRWAETHPDELTAVVAQLSQTDCLILGRTQHAFATHPHALQDTEALINAVFSHLLDLAVDLGGGARGWSRRAAEVILAWSEPTAWGDASWPVLAQRSGLPVSYRAVDGLAWETADRYQPGAVDGASQQAAAARIDRDAAKWAMRVRVAREIIVEGLAAIHKVPITEPEVKPQPYKNT
jgi:hypothetical protein